MARMTAFRSRLVISLFGAWLTASIGQSQPLPELPNLPPNVPPVLPNLPKTEPPKPQEPPTLPEPTEVPKSETPTAMQPGNLVQPPQLFPAYNSGQVAVSDPLLAPNPVQTWNTPLPGSVEDEYTRELQARQNLQTSTWTGTRIQAFPNSLLWESPFAVKKDPRMQFLATDLQNYRSSYTIDTSVGGTMGLVRFDLNGSDTRFQVDLFGVIQTRLSPDDLLLGDYRFGLPLTWQRGWWQGKIGYEHTSAHLGDELIVATGRFPRSYARDEIVVGLGRVILEQARVYGHVAYAFMYGIPDRESTTENRTRFDVGFDWFDRNPTGLAGTPFVAGNAEFRGDQDFSANYTIQAGWLWRNPLQRFGQARLFVEHYRGFSPYGQTFQERENFTSVGFAFDY